MNLQLTPIVKNLLIINILVWISLQILTNSNQGLGKMVNGDFFTLHKSNLLGFRDEALLEGYGVVYVSKSGYGPANKFNPVQILTSMFNHDSRDFRHILFNMFALLMIGPMIEMVMGSKRFLKFYLFCGLVGGILVAFLDPSPTPVVGASGAILGLIVAFAFHYPNRELLLFFVLPMKAVTLAWVAGIGSAALFILDTVGTDMAHWSNISHFGHLAGMIGALIFFYIRPKIPFLR